MGHAWKPDGAIRPCVIQALIQKLDERIAASSMAA
jgi:hypothetical protein